MRNSQIDSVTLHNISLVDRIIRLAITVALILAVLSIPNYAVFENQSYLALYAIYPAFTVVAGWDPIYEIFGISSIPNKQKQFVRLVEKVDFEAGATA